MPVFSRLWKSDWHLSVLLGLLLLVVFIIYPMGGRGPLAGAVRQFFLSLILISGAVLVARNRKTLWIAVALALITAAAGWARLGSSEQWVSVLSLLMWIVFLVLLAVAILFRVFEDGEINVHRIQGAVAVYLLLGVIWAGCYRLVVEADPTAFNFPAVADEGSLM
jgi:hypothetical protein